MFICVCSVILLCPTLFNPMDCSAPGSSVHGILQARILERVAISSSGGSSQPRDQTHTSYVSCIGRWILYHFASWQDPVVNIFRIKSIFLLVPSVLYSFFPLYIYCHWMLPSYYFGSYSTFSVWPSFQYFKGYMIYAFFVPLSNSLRWSSKNKTGLRPGLESWL